MFRHYYLYCLFYIHCLFPIFLLVLITLLVASRASSLTCPNSVEFLSSFPLWRHSCHSCPSFCGLLSFYWILSLTLQFAYRSPLSFFFKSMGSCPRDISCCFGIPLSWRRFLSMLHLLFSAIEYIILLLAAHC